MCTAAISQCCKSTFVVDGGFSCCRNCGGVAIRELDVNHTSFLQNTYTLKSNQYTRTKRFSQKILGALLRKTNYKPNPNLMLYLNSCRRRGLIQTPEDLLDAMSLYKTGGERRPYMHAATLWNEMVGTRKLPELAIAEERFISMIFEEIFYVWTRLELSRPRLPMSQALILIVHHFNLSTNAKFLVRFARKLKCGQRRERYKRLFLKCIAHIRNDENRVGRFEKFPFFTDS